MRLRLLWAIRLFFLVTIPQQVYAVVSPGFVEDPEVFFSDNGVVPATVELTKRAQASGTDLRAVMAADHSNKEGDAIAASALERIGNVTNITNVFVGTDSRKLGNGTSAGPSSGGANADQTMTDVSNGVGPANLQPTSASGANPVGNGGGQNPTSSGLASGLGAPSFSNPTNPIGTQAWLDNVLEGIKGFKPSEYGSSLGPYNSPSGDSGGRQFAQMRNQSQREATTALEPADVTASPARTSPGPVVASAPPAPTTRSSPPSTPSTTDVAAFRSTFPETNKPTTDPTTKPVHSGTVVASKEGSGKPGEEKPPTPPSTQPTAPSEGGAGPTVPTSNRLNQSTNSSVSAPANCAEACSRLANKVSALGMSVQDVGGLVTKVSPKDNQIIGQDANDISDLLKGMMQFSNQCPRVFAISWGRNSELESFKLDFAAEGARNVSECATNFKQGSAGEDDSRPASNHTTNAPLPVSPPPVKAQ